MAGGGEPREPQPAAAEDHVYGARVRGRGLHSSTSPLKFSAVYGMGGARRGRVARVKGVLGCV